jgi:uncharacterized protein YndB with AHSA1/START domain
MTTPISEVSPELVITRIFHAPRPLVWQAWTDPQQLVQWMGPPQHPAKHCEGELRVGGQWRSRLEATDGSDELWNGGVYREIVEPERLVFTFAWDGDDGRPENEMLIELSFEEHPAGTKMTLRQTAFRSVEQRDNHRGGWNGCFDRLEGFLAREK